MKHCDGLVHFVGHRYFERCQTKSTENKTKERKKERQTDKNKKTEKATSGTLSQKTNDTVILTLSLTKRHESWCMSIPGEELHRADELEAQL